MQISIHIKIALGKRRLNCIPCLVSFFSQVTTFVSLDENHGCIFSSVSSFLFILAIAHGIR